MHAYRRLALRRISPQDAIEVVRNGEIVESYPEDQPRPSYLMVGWPRGQPLHVVVSRDDVTLRCFIVTVYDPDPAKWRSKFRVRRK